MFWLNEFNFGIGVGRGFSLKLGKSLRIFGKNNLSQLISLMIVFDIYNLFIPKKLDIVYYYYQYNSIFCFGPKGDILKSPKGKNRKKLDIFSRL